MTEFGLKVSAALTALVVVAAGVLLVVLRPWADDGGTATQTPPATPPQEDTVTVLAAGDIARCGNEVDEATAELVAERPDAVVLGLGDLAYNDGSAEDFQECYHPTWGRFADRTYPVPGNHEYRTRDAGPYFDYFGDRAGERGKGWYSVDLGRWHVVALNSNCEDVDCDAGSEQEQWLRADLEAAGSRCTLALWHAPRYSSGARHGGTRDVEDLWEVLVEHDVDVLLASHEHLYERIAPLDEEGAVDPQDGVRTFVVGTGGGNFYELGERIPGSEAAVEGVGGVLEMTLRPDGYDWEFLSVPEGAYTDSGSDVCR